MAESFLVMLDQPETIWQNGRKVTLKLGKPIAYLRVGDLWANFGLPVNDNRKKQ